MGQQLRVPTPPPDPQNFLGRAWQLKEIADWLRQRRADRMSHSRGSPAVLVLHGPAGVGKSALAAVACRPHNAVTHWVSLDDATTADVEPTLLRLLAESGAPRAAIVRATLDGGRGFRRTLRHELSQRMYDRLLVLDGASPPVVRALLSGLRDCRGLVVLVTSRTPDGWRRTGATLLGIAPMSSGETQNVISAVAGRPLAGGLWYETTFSTDQLVRGLPALARIAGALARRMPPPSEKPKNESGPQWLIRLALAGCTPGQQQVLRDLAQRDSAAPFTLRSVESLYMEKNRTVDARDLLHGLRARELVQRWHGNETFCLPEPVAEAVRPRTPSATTPPVVWAARVLQDTAGLLDGRPRPWLPAGQELERLAPGELAPFADAFMALLSHGQGSPHEQDRIADGLAVVLAVLGDAHRLVALHRLRPLPAVRRALGSLAADLGRPQWAVTLFDPGVWASPDAVHQGAAICHQSGRLSGALNVLEVLLREETRPEDRQHTAWGLLVLGAVRCDRGEAAEAEQALVRATALHRASGCRRGLGWTLLHRARVCLLTGREAEADRLLDEADEKLRSVADTRGRNWVETERIRVALLRGRLERAVVVASQAERQHTAAEDIRGIAWTSLYLALGHLGKGDLRTARSALDTAEKHFLECGDELGSAWAKHRIALLPLSDSQGATALVSLGPAWDLFGKIGCPLGTAWTELEMAARRRPSELTLPLLSTAKERFRALGDTHGQAWATVVDALVRNQARKDEAPQTLDDVVASVPGDVPARERLVRELTRFWEGKGVVGGQVIPFHARDAVAVRHTTPDTLDLPGAVGPRCRVRVTLLDDTPAEDTTARLLLRVSPEDGHPWRAAEAERPWLTVTAAPLTHGSVDPASALLRPSEQAARGAEFGFTAHCTGTHRIRFTIALERTGTVLQQVETELDILDHDDHGGLSSPAAVTHRGR
ncbi:tetratricopeptide repeat protein [Streptomyces violarus]|uniref:tetratricopeptide repeat protein n=1 Tax=Streptomyces violarus TaxID=67380 RepID=UPI0021BE0D3D|nr:tetratricopeptide repeat protein [Streptomyces violarus]MCT9143339.1 tetratricopeptide repeat protein [Streptomyces violarus]